MKKVALVSTLALILTACGGGSDNSSDNGNSGDNGNGGTVTAPAAIKGTIDSVNTAQKKVVVNGYSYDVADVVYGDTKLKINDLQANMMVQIGAAQKVTGVQVNLEPTITGTVTDIDRVAGTFIVNGITLTYKLSTEIELGDWVMVSSLPTANAGYKVLSVVKFENDDLINHYEVEGRLTNLDNNALSFSLGAALTVDYSAAKVEDNAVLSNGQWVEVEGTMNLNTLEATSVEVEDYKDLANDTEVEGIVTWVDAQQTAFELNYQGRFVINEHTKFEDGLKKDLKQGALVEVTSVKQGTQQVATEVEFDDDNSTGDDDGNGNIGSWKEFEAEGFATSVNAIDKSFVITTKGKAMTIYVDAKTQFEDRLQFDTIDQQRIEVEGVVINGQNIAREIEADDND
ncbi:DUF5666 domain-containing protein [Shewanella fidelis]|uniref:DUF5666 domain-containing protein n=1 Tax=Shewanella fidelis TaxID=173509 RepID=A0AAW8NSP0_9GAMM|nr:DUF5666 domain-containing protein [Shewanella fidelis]MDR8526184.1 DUF5666 domain-containing protein [Shewanella fidelis]MDW4813797.1 DUF5666 domain-containing protein [Shewanella fidelis]MDW4817893.1 DUF5666 domain-containing protein [Shewanella fidelis]MDW4821846.1 DUF5666 domain-containing protein [Shewanella fidelis]MDW4826125.1 DUF5666 domain-containing protein [Shewanella fidelis]